MYQGEGSNEERINNPIPPNTLVSLHALCPAIFLAMVIPPMI